MKSNEFSSETLVETEKFFTPMRQSYAAILLMAYKLYKVLIRQLFPFLLIILFGGSMNKKGTLMYFIIVVAVLGFIYSVVAFFKYYFYLSEDKLIVQKGVFKKSKIEIPFDRIQSINFEQNLIHRLFNVVKLNMDTAGSSNTELQIVALDASLASNISEYILKHKAEQVDQSESVIDKQLDRTKKVIFRLSIPQLLKVGITENHLRSGGIIIFFFFWIWENLRDMGTDVMDKMKDYAPLAEALTASLVVISALVILFMILSFIISLIRTILKYYNLNMYRMGDGFIVESGLLNRREYAAKDHKIQVLTWSQNLLQNWSDIFELKLKQASSIAVADKKSLQVAGLDWEDVQETEAYLLKEYYPELLGIETQGVHPYYRFRHFYYWTLFLLPAIVIFTLLQEQKIAIALVAFYIYGLVSTQLSYKKKRFGISKNLLLLRGGTFGHKATILQLFKLQNIMIGSTPFQRKRNLGSLTVFTASGQVTIPDIALQTCLDLKNYLLYKIESSEKSWF